MARKPSAVCKLGHDKPLGARCPQCQRLRYLKWSDAHPGLARERAIEWHRDNRDRHLEYMRGYAKEHREESRLRVNAWAAKNREHVNQMSRESYARNAEKHQVLTKRWREENRELWREINNASKSRRRARLKDCEGSHTAAEWQKVLTKFKHRCVWCGSSDDIQKDHIIPVAWRGSDYVWNLQPLCQPCNRAKSASIVEGTQLGIFDKVKETLNHG